VPSTPPVSHAGPLKVTSNMRPCGIRLPFGVPMTKNCMKSNAMWKPTANHSVPVRRTVKHSSMLIETSVITSQIFSPSL
jgi:hypothetical protein